LGYTYDREPHGLNDSKNFSGDYERYKRIFVLGDSFTGGGSAGPAKSYVDLLNSIIKSTGYSFFNTGVATTVRFDRQTAVRKSGKRELAFKATKKFLLGIGRYLAERGLPFPILLIPEFPSRKTTARGQRIL
jgi:hypothetical protein